MTGKEIKTIRQQLGLTKNELALRLGISSSSVHRWESRETTAWLIDPLQRQLFSLLSEQLTRNDSEFGKSIKSNITLKGGLFALYRFLHHVYTQEQP